MNQCRRGIIYLSKKIELYVSTISDNPKNIFKNLELYENLGVSGIHFDIMDGNFVPRFGLYPELMKELRSNTNLPIECHLMVQNSEKYLNQMIASGANRIIVHIEALEHPHRTISVIKQLGAEVGIALNPGTGFNQLEYLIDDINLVLVMAINPGIPKHPFIIQSLQKISRLRKFLDTINPNVQIGVDGGVTFDNAKEISECGANTLICGSGTFFKEDNSLSENIKILQNKLYKIE
jgi:ribulose-phosphate 3-epimerase